MWLYRALCKLRGWLSFGAYICLRCLRSSEKHLAMDCILSMGFSLGASVVLDSITSGA